jgi:hypothetical protein
MAAAQASLLGRIAVSAKLITQEQLLVALGEQDRLGPSQRFGDILLQLGYVSQAQLDWLLRAQVTVLERQRQAEAEAQRQAQAQQQPMTTRMSETVASATTSPVAPPSPSGERRLDSILSKAIQMHASDVHVHTGLPVQMRISGRLVKANSPPLEPAQAEALVMEIQTEPERAQRSRLCLFPSRRRPLSRQRLPTAQGHRRRLPPHSAGAAHLGSAGHAKLAGAPDRLSPGPRAGDRTGGLREVVDAGRAHQPHQRRPTRPHHYRRGSD